MGISVSSATAIRARTDGSSSISAITIFVSRTYLPFIGIYLLATFFDRLFHFYQILVRDRSRKTQ